MRPRHDKEPEVPISGRVPFPELIVPLDKYYKQYGWNRYVTPLTTKQSIRDGHIYAVTFSRRTRYRI